MAMTGVQPNASYAFHKSAGNLHNDLQQVAGNGGYYVSREIGNEMGNVNTNLGSMNFDSTLLETSKEWSKRFDPESLTQEKAGAAQNLSNAHSLMQDYKGKFNATSVEQMQPNQLREAHEAAKQGFQSVQSSLDPYVDASKKRIDQFSDHIGVTDRYTGYRNNLTRGQRGATKMGMTWLDSNDPGSYKASMQGRSAGGSFLPASLPKSKVGMQGNNRLTQSAVNPWTATNLCARRPPPTRSIQEQCGINTTFPGKTEYMKRYNKVHPPEPLTKFRINPTPDFGIYGRPLTQYKYEPAHTEYQTRYEWPDGAKVVRKPWLRN